MARAGAVWLDVLPNMAGLNKSVKAQAKVSLASAGKTAGVSYATGLKGAIVKGLSGTGAEIKAELEAGAKEAAAAVSEAEGRLAAARKAEADAAGKLRVAEQKLADVRSKEYQTFSEYASAEERVAAAQRNSELAAGKATAATKELETAQGAAAGASDAAAASGGRFSGALGKVGKASSSLGGKISGLTKGVASMGGIFAGIEIAKFGAESVKTAMDFQKGSQVLVTAAGESMKNLGSVRSGLEQISSTTGTSLDQMTEGMYTVEKAGIRGGKGLNVMAAAAKGAKDEGADLQVVTDALTTIMRTSGGKITVPAKAMNALMVAAGHSKTSLQEFAGSLGSVLPTASKVGITFDQVSGAISAMTSQGMSAQRSTMNLNRFISSLISPTTKMAVAMSSFGISSDTVSKMLGKKGLQSTIDYLSQSITKRLGPGVQASMAAVRKMPKDAQALFNALKNGTVTVTQFNEKSNSLKDITNKQRTQLQAAVPAAQGYTKALAAMTGGSQNLRTALMLTGTSSDLMRRSTEDVGKAMNSTADFNKKWGITSKTTANELSIAKQSIANVGTSIATSLLPPLGKMATGFANGLMAVTQFAKANQSWLVPMAKVVGIAAAAFVALGPAMKIAAAMQNLYAFAAARSAIAQGELDVAMDANPIGAITTAIELAVVALAALAAGVIYAYKHWAWFRTGVDAVGTALKTAALAVKTAFLATVNWITGSFIPFFTKTIPGVFSSVKNWISTTWSTVSTDIQKPFLATWKWLSGPFAGFFTKTLPGFFSGVGKAIAAPFEAAGTALTPVISGIWSVIQKAFQIGVSIVTDYLKIQWKIVDVLIATPVRAAIRLVQDAWAKLKGPFTSAVKWVGTTFKVGWNRTTGFVSSAVHAAVRPVQLAWTAVRDAFTAAAKWVGKTFKAAWQHDVAVVTAIVHAVIQPIKVAWTAVRSAFTAAGQWVAGVFKKAWQRDVAVVTYVVHAIIQPIRDAWSAVRGAFTSAKDWVAGTFSRSWSAIKGRLTGPISAAKSAIGTLLGRTKRGLQWEFSEAVKAIGAIWTGLQAAVKAPIKFVIQTVLNNGLIAGFNKIAQFAWGNAKHNIGTIPLPKGFDRGGVLPGFTPVAKGDDQLRPMRSGEGVAVSEAMRDPYERSRLLALNKAALSGGLAAVRQFRSGDGYKLGGIVRPVRNSIGLAQGIHDVGAMGPNSSAVDFAAPIGTPVVAGAAGKVIQSYDIKGYEPRRAGPQDGYRSYGRVIEIASQGFNTLYAHLSQRIAQAGATVAAGQEIGISGNTGNTTGPHLHFGAQNISPFDFVNAAYSQNGVASGGGLISSIINAGKNIWGKVKGAVSDPLSLLQAAISHSISGVMKFGNSSLVQTIAQIPKKLVSDAGSALVGKIGGVFGAGSTSSGVSGNAQEVIHSMMLQRWPESQWMPLKTLIQNESSWNDRNRNPSSGAFGLFQLLGANYAALHGNYSDQNQGKVGLGYIDTRYGTPANALAQWMSRNPHWYDTGGIMPPGLSLSYNGTGRGEHQAMFTDRQWAALTQIAERPGGDTIIIQGVADKAGAAREIEQLLLSHGRSVSGVRTVRKNS